MNLVLYDTIQFVGCAISVLLLSRKMILKPACELYRLILLLQIAILSQIPQRMTSPRKSAMNCAEARFDYLRMWSSTTGVHRCRFEKKGANSVLRRLILIKAEQGHDGKNAIGSAQKVLQPRKVGRR